MYPTLYLTPGEIHRHHEIVLDALHQAGSAWLKASEGLTRAGAQFARASLAAAPAAGNGDGKPFDQAHLDGLRSEARFALGHGVKVSQRLLADLVDAMAIQRQHIDALIVAGLERSARMLPDPLVHVVHGAETTLLTVEHTADDVAKAGMRGIRRAAAAVEDAVQPARSAPAAPAAPARRRPSAAQAPRKAAGAKRNRG